MSRCCSGKPLSPDLKDALVTDASGHGHLASSLERPTPMKEIVGLRLTSEKPRESPVTMVPVTRMGVSFRGVSVTEQSRDPLHIYKE